MLLGLAAQRRGSDGRCVDHAVPRHQGDGRARPDVRHRSRRRRLARGHRLRRRDARPVRALRLLARDRPARTSRRRRRTRARRCCAFIHQIVPTLDRDRADRRSVARLDRVVLRLSPQLPRRSWSRCTRTIRSRRARRRCSRARSVPADGQRVHVRSYDFLYDERDVTPSPLDGLGTDVLRARHRRALHALGLGQARDVDQPDRGPVHRSRTRTRIRARS